MCECCTCSLEHDLRWIIARQEAPIPPMPMRELLSHLYAALERWELEQAEARMPDGS